MNKINLPGYECQVCGHRWSPQLAGTPMRCAWCKSPYWQKKPDKESKMRGTHEEKCMLCREVR